VRVVIGLGANLDGQRERIESLRAAVMELTDLDGVRVIARSRVYETAAVGPPQPDYLNAAILVECTRSLDELMTSLLEIERGLGRERREKWGPRTIDLDILWAEGTVQSTPHLTVPHPHLHERSFAIKPLLDVAPDATDPTTRERYADLTLGDAAGVRLSSATL
jgi:2-amino-4-hydroxy-6-hydroxymethyldihydropteridine diphosphokinase